MEIMWITALSSMDLYILNYLEDCYNLGTPLAKGGPQTSFLPATIPWRFFFSCIKMSSGFAALEDPVGQKLRLHKSNLE